MPLLDIRYPVEVKQYTVSITKGIARIELKGIEEAKPERQSSDSDTELLTIGRIIFDALDPSGDKDLISRDGVLRMERPLSMLPGVLNLLQHEKPVFLHGDGTLSTSLESIGETESLITAG